MIHFILLKSTVSAGILVICDCGVVERHNRSGFGWLGKEGLFGPLLHRLWA